MILIRLKLLAHPKMSFPTLHLLLLPIYLPQSAQFLYLSSLAYLNHVKRKIASLPKTTT